MGNKNGAYETFSEETKDLLMQQTGKPIHIRYNIIFGLPIC
jgi:hypothetical protein